MSSWPLCGSNVGSGEDEDTIVNGDWSLALQVKQQCLQHTLPSALCEHISTCYNIQDYTAHKHT